MQRIHARDAAGQWLDGVAVFEAAYRAAEIESVARLWGHPKLQPLLDPIYMWVARHRMQLSRLGLNKVYGYLVRRAAQRAARRSRTCADKTGCALDNTAS
jgi:predicted DCC family thiol-disulfide oxidoreductase YuxK